MKDHGQKEEPGDSKQDQLQREIDQLMSEKMELDNALVQIKEEQSKITPKPVKTLKVEDFNRGVVLNNDLNSPIKEKQETCREKLKDIDPVQADLTDWWQAMKKEEKDIKV